MSRQGAQAQLLSFGHHILRAHPQAAKPSVRGHEVCVRCPCSGITMTGFTWSNCWPILGPFRMSKSRPKGMKGKTISTAQTCIWKALYLSKASCYIAWRRRSCAGTLAAALNFMVGTSSTFLVFFSSPLRGSPASSAPGSGSLPRHMWAGRCGCRT